MAVKNSKKRKFDVKDFIIVILTFSTVFAIIYSLRRGPKQEFENTSPVISQQEEKKSSHELIWWHFLNLLLLVWRLM